MIVLRAIVTDVFRRRFRMERALFEEIVDKVVQFDDWFRQKRDATGLLGLSSLQKICCAGQMFATRNSPDDMDDKYRLAESTALELLKRFSQAIVVVYGPTQLRA